MTSKVKDTVRPSVLEPEKHRFAVSSPGFYCLHCMRKSTDFTHVIIPKNRDLPVYCPKCKRQMRRD